MLSCNHDCFRCPYPDVPDECLQAHLTQDEYRELRWIDSEIINPKTDAQKKRAAYKKAYTEANKKKFADKQKCIREARKYRGMRQSDLAQLVGVSQGVISTWEQGRSPANWDNLCAVLPELEEYRP